MNCSTLVLKKTFFPDRFRLPPPHPQNNVENIIWHNSKTIPTLYEGVGGQNVVKNEKSLNLGDSMTFVPDCGCHPLIFVVAFCQSTHQFPNQLANFPICIKFISVAVHENESFSDQTWKKVVCWTTNDDADFQVFKIFIRNMPTWT